MNLEEEIEKLHPHSEQHAALCELLMDLRETEDKTRQLCILLPHNAARYHEDLEQLRQDMFLKAQQVFHPHAPSHDQP